MMVYADGFRCLSCGRRGSLDYLYHQIGTSVSSSVKVYKPNILPKWSRWARQYGDVPQIAEMGHRILNGFAGHRDFFKRRGIEQFIEPGCFGYIDGWALFPVFDQKHRVIDIVVRATKGKGDTKYVLRPDKGRAVPNLYVPNWQRVIESETVYVVYGIIDAWALEDLELACVTGTTGQSLSSAQLKPIEKNMVIIPDRYEEDSAYTLANQIGWKARVKLVKWPEGTKDCDNIRMMFGKEELRNHIGG